MAKICRRTGKVGYRSVTEADAALRAIEAAPTSLARHYDRVKRETAAFKCMFCPRWHLTSEVQVRGNGVNLRSN